MWRDRCTVHSAHNYSVFFITKNEGRWIGRSGDEKWPLSSPDGAVSVGKTETASILYNEKATTKGDTKQHTRKACCSKLK